MHSLPAFDRSLFAGIVAAEGARVVAVARAGPLDARVPHLRRWTLTDVIAHLGGVHRWAAEIVSTQSMTRGHHRGRDTGDALVRWFDEGLAQLTAVLNAADLDMPCPNFSPGGVKTTAFWARRQAHETTIHRWDAESSTGAPGPIEPSLASDGIDELLHVFTRSRGGQQLSAPLALVCSDTGASWAVRPADKPGRVAVERAVAGGTDAASELATPAATASGTAENLLLCLWHRLPLGAADLAISGQSSVAEEFITGPVSP